MSNKKLKKIVKQLKGSSKMHGAQAKTLEKMSSEKNFLKIYASGSKRSGLTLEPPRRVVDLNRVDGLRVRREVGILSVCPLLRLLV